MSEGGDYQKPDIKALFPSHYQILGVDEKATPEQIKAAYHNTAKQFHPDLRGDDPQKEKKEEHLKRVNIANEILSDPSKKGNYDFYLNSQKEKWMRERKAKEESIPKTVNIDPEIEINRAKRRTKRTAAERAYAKETSDINRRTQQAKKEKNEQRLDEEMARGEEMGIKLANWIFTPEGRKNMDRYTQELLEGAKDKEGMLSFMNKESLYRSRAERIRDESIDGLGSIAREILNQVVKKKIKKGQLPPLSEEGKNSFIQDYTSILREQAFALRYAQGDPTKLDSLIPDRLNPQDHPEIIDKVTKRALITGFKQGWEKMKKEQNAQRAESSVNQLFKDWKYNN